VRFCLDNDVDVAVGRMLRHRGHECWTVHQAGLAAASDDALTVYATERKAVLVTHDREFSQRRRRNTVGRHLWLNCEQFHAEQLLGQHLDEVIRLLNSRQDCMVSISQAGVEISWGWD
jgi:predicted nuclease of predicted toxin-antitoxin system